MGGTLQTRTMLATFGCEEVEVVHREEEDQSAGRLVEPKFPDIARDEEQGPSSSIKGPKREDGRKEDVIRKSLCNMIPIRLRSRTIRLQQEGCPAFLMAAYGERGVLDRPNMRLLKWRNGALSGSDLGNEPGLGCSRTYQPGEMPLPTKPRPGLRRIHQEMNSEAASSSS